MSLPRRSDRAAPLLLLLLFLCAVYGLRPLLHLRGSARIPPHEAHHVQIGGVVHAFSGEPSLREVTARAGIHAVADLDTDSHQVFSSGERLDIRKEGTGTRLTRGEMNGFFKMTLGIPLSINRESEAGLTALPNIGPGLARAMIEERTRRGGFKSLEDLITVPGIGPRRFLKIKPFIKL
jgi:competence protein ComEA